MKKVSGLRFHASFDMGFQFSGWLIQQAAIFIVILLTGFSIPVLGQERRYSFKQGEVLEYEVIDTWGADEPGEIPSKEILKFRFVVISAEKDRFCLTMQMISMRNVAVTITDQTSKIAPELRSNVSIVGTNNSVINAVMNNPINFTLDSRGKIIDFQGDYEVRNEILRSAESEPAIKELWDYHEIELYYGAQKFKYQIQEIFPELPETFIDSVSIESGNNSAYRIDSWPVKSNFSERSDTIVVQRAYTIKIGDDLSASSPFNTVNQMTILWPISSGYPLRTRFKGFTSSDIISFILQNQEIPFKPRPIEIINTSRSDNTTRRVHINGSISNLTGRKLEVHLPGTGISKEIVPVKADPNGAFFLDFDLGIAAGIADFRFENERQNLVRIFVKPGDSVSFSANLNDLTTIEFDGKTSNEQTALSQFLITNSMMHTEESLQNVRNNMKFLSQANLGLEPEFLKFMEKENSYTLYTRQMQKIMLQYGIPLHVPWDSIRKFRKFLGDPDGYQSDAYKSFVYLLVYASYEALSSSQSDFFNFAPTVLTGWDLYWYRAMEVERFSSDSPEGNYDREFRQFSDLYPGTEFQRILYEKFKLTEKGRTGNVLPKIKFTDIAGKTYSSRNYRGRYWCIVNTGSDPEETKKQLFETKTFIGEQGETIIFFIWANNDTIRNLAQSRVDGKNMILLAGRDKNQTLAEFLSGLPPDIMVIDPAGRIATYGLGGLPELMTWPVSKVSAQKTVNLAVFWYSLGGAFVLAIVIILVIRIRSKRKEARINLKRKIAQLEVDAVRSRMNPHFLFNALGSIQNLVNKGKNQEASQYLARFGDMVRTILTQSSKPVIGLNEEIDMIRNYLLLEQLGSPFAFDIEVDPVLDPATIEIPPMLIQPHVENAVIHGISSLGAAGKIKVGFRREEQQLICEVTDNGPGYHPGLNPEKEGLGQGWKLTRQRIQLMKEQYGEEVSVEVSDGIPDSDQPSGISGTKVTFRLPLQNSSL